MSQEKQAAPNDVFNNYDKYALDRPRDKAWDNWKSWSNEIGDKVQGYVRDVFYRPEEGEFSEQRCFTLEQPDGKYVNVGTKRKSFIMPKTDYLRIGDPLTIVLEELKEPARKGYNATKIMGYYGTNLDETEGNKTVLQAEKEDIARQNEEGADASQPQGEKNEENGEQEQAANEAINNF